MPEGDFQLPLGEARVARPGSDITLVAWGQQVAVLERAVRPPVLTPAPGMYPCLTARGVWWRRDRRAAAGAGAQAAEVAEADGISCEVIDLRTLLPWDRATVGARLALSDRRWVLRARTPQARACARLRISADT